MTELNEEINLLEEQIKLNRSEIVAIDKEKKVLSEQIRYMQIYKENKPFHKEYLHVKNPDDYLMRNETRLTLFDGAVNILRSHGLDPEKVSLEDLQEKYEKMNEKRMKLKSENDAIKPRLDALLQEQRTLNTYLDRENIQEELSNKRNKQNPER